MRRITSLLAGALVGAFFVGCAQAQSFDGEIGAGHVVGNPSASATTATDATLTAMFDRAFCATANNVIARISGSWVCLATANSAVWVTDSGGVPSLSQTLPSAVQANITRTGTLIAGASGAGFTLNFSTSTLSGQIPIANGGCNGTTNTTCFNNAAPAPTRAGDIIYYNGSNWVSLAGNNSGTNVLQENPSGVPSWVPAPGTVTSAVVAPGGNAVATGTCTITTSGTCTVSVEQMTPGGRVTLVSGGCKVTTDQVAQTSIYYSPCGSRWVPIYDGTNMTLKQFTSSAADAQGLSLTLTAGFLANTLYDTFVGLNASTVTFCYGPAWSVSTAGSGARGSGAGTTQLALFDGLWTNAVSMTCTYSAGSTFTCGVNQCTYVGTVLAGGSNGQVDLKFGTLAAGGGAAKLSICNQYRRDIQRAEVGDTAGSWTYTSASFRAANAGTVQVTTVSCQADVTVVARYSQRNTVAANTAFTQLGIGLNSTSAVDSDASTGFFNPNLSGASTIHHSFLDKIPPAGQNVFSALEASDGTNANTFFGSAANGQRFVVRAEM